MQSVQSFSFVVYISSVRIECQIKNVLKPKEHFWIVLIKISFRNEELNHICRKIKLTLCDRIMALIDAFLVLWVLYAWSPDRKWFPKLYRKWFSDGKEGNIWTQEFGQWTWNLYYLIFFITAKLRKPWTLWYDSERFIMCWTNHNKVQDKRKHLKTTTYIRCCLQFSFSFFPYCTILFL